MTQPARPTRKPTVRRRIRAPLGLALALFTLTLAIPATASALISTGDGGWSRQNPLPQGSYLSDVAFSDATHGWAVGGTGTILATTDGGVTWTAQTSGTAADLAAVSFVDTVRGWAVGTNGTILATLDGGSIWNRQSSGSTVSLRDVAFTDATHGWAVGDSGAILATTNGGVTWSAQSSGSSADLSAVAFTDATHGWVVGTDRDSAGPISQIATILATTNGGTSWKKQPISGSQVAEQAQLMGVAFSDAQHGWAVGRVWIGDAGVILATTDGGATWKEQAYRGTVHYDVTFTDAKHGWVVGKYGDIDATTDGGVTWQQQTSGLEQSQTISPLTAVAFTDAKHGWVVGQSWDYDQDSGTITESAVILSTTTGGFDVARDSDGDGLPDEWETNGVDTNGDGVIEVDLPAMGADPNRKDIFVEIDWMVDPPTTNFLGWKVGGHSHEPKAEALQKVMDAFKAQGIALHVDAGPGSVMDPYHPEKKWGKYSAAATASAAEPVIEVKDLGRWISKDVYDWTAFNSIMKTDFPADRSRVFHYCVFAHKYGGGKSTGIARFDKPVLIVADGSTSSAFNDNMNPTEQAGTFMHELGHNLWLLHGGGDGINNKPNYLSIMNYSFQLTGLLKDGAFGPLDYSGAKLDTLKEVSLNEGDGIGPKSAVGDLGTVYWRDGRGPNLIDTRAPFRVNSLLGAIDWNGYWGDRETGIEEDLNTGRNATEIVLGEELTGYDDWANLHFDVGGAIGPSPLAGAAKSVRSSPSTELSPDEPSYEEFVASGLVLRDYRVAVTADGGNVVMATPSAGVLSLSIKVTNEGLEPDTYSLQAWGLGGASLGTVPSSVQLSAGASETVSVPLTLPAGTPGGLVGSVRLLATSTSSPEISDEVEVAVYVKSPAPTVTLKLSGLKGGVVKLGRVVTATGAVSPLSLVGSRVTLTVQRKTGATWVKMKATFASIGPKGKYSWKYKPAKKGTYRMRAAIAKTATLVAAKTPWRGFRVK